MLKLLPALYDTEYASLLDRAKNKKDRLAAVATLAYEVTLVQAGFRCRPNAFIGYLRKHKEWLIVNKM